MVLARIGFMQATVTAGEMSLDRARFGPRSRKRLTFASISPNERAANKKA
jgi:hypothetical protein